MERWKDGASKLKLRQTSCRSLTKTVILARLFLSALVFGLINLEMGIGPTELRASDGAIVLFPARPGPALKTDTSFVRCLTKRLSKEISPPPTIVKTRDFQNALFPWFEPRYAPKTASELQALLSRSYVREKIVALGVRYLVATAGATKTNGFPGMLCGYSGCFGLYMEDKTTSVSAVVLDMMSDDQEARLQAQTAGTTFIPAFIIPVPLIAQTEQEACQDLGMKLRDLLLERSGKATSFETPPLCRDVGGYEAYMKETGKVCRLN